VKRHPQRGAWHQRWIDESWEPHTKLKQFSGARMIADIRPMKSDICYQQPG